MDLNKAKKHNRCTTEMELFKINKRGPNLSNILVLNMGAFCQGPRLLHIILQTGNKLLNLFVLRLFLQNDSLNFTCNMYFRDLKRFSEVEIHKLKIIFSLIDYQGKAVTIQNR